jgi:hypothetical protein
MGFEVGKKMEADVSNKTIVVLVVLTVIISILSALVVMNEVQNINIGSGPRIENKNLGGGNSGQVSFEIIKKEPSIPSTGTGRVAFEILPHNN